MLVSSSIFHQDVGGQHCSLGTHQCNQLSIPVYSEASCQWTVVAIFMLHSPLLWLKTASHSYLGFIQAWKWKCGSPWTPEAKAVPAKWNLISHKSPGNARCYQKRFLRLTLLSSCSTLLSWLKLSRLRHQISFFLAFFNTHFPFWRVC